MVASLVLAALLLAAAPHRAYGIDFADPHWTAVVERDARSGLRPGDVVLELDGETITSPHEFYRRVLDTPPGRTVELTIERSGEAKRLEMRVRPIDTTPRA